MLLDVSIQRSKHKFELQLRDGVLLKTWYSPKKLLFDWDLEKLDFKRREWQQADISENL